jgi:hypothetical protein
MAEASNTEYRAHLATYTAFNKLVLFMILWLVLLLRAWPWAWSAAAACRLLLGIGGTVALLIAFAVSRRCHAAGRRAPSGARPASGKKPNRRSRCRRRSRRSRSRRSPANPSRAPSWPRSTRRNPCGWCRRGVGRVGGAHDLAVLGDRALASSTWTTTGPEVMKVQRSLKNGRALCTP